MTFSEKKSKKHIYIVSFGFSMNNTFKLVIPRMYLYMKTDMIFVTVKKKKKKKKKNHVITGFSFFLSFFCFVLFWFGLVWFGLVWFGFQDQSMYSRM